VPPGWDHVYTLSHNAHLVAFSVDACLILWDLLKDKELWHGNEHFYLIESINFSQDDKYIVTGARDATIKIWDVESGKSIRTISKSKKVPWIKADRSKWFRLGLFKRVERKRRNYLGLTAIQKT
jgi:WD40 repeat protein